MKVLVLGITGMLGSTLFRDFHQSGSMEVVGTVRSAASPQILKGGSGKARVLCGIDVTQSKVLERTIGDVSPDVIINCIGLVKQLQEANDPVKTIQVNSLLPHQIYAAGRSSGARVVQVSTDCVFSGARGYYAESDVPDANDLYGKSKLLGELEHEGAITLRTSIIGPEISSSHGLFQWFLSQDGIATGYRRAVFSGFPTIELARIIREHVIPNPGVHGIYHLAANPIDKFSLLSLIRDEYEKKIELVPSDAVRIDRSLDASRFNAVTNYAPPGWRSLIRAMKASDYRNT